MTREVLRTLVQMKELIGLAGILLFKLHPFFLILPWGRQIRGGALGQGIHFFPI